METTDVAALFFKIVSYGVLFEFYSCVLHAPKCNILTTIIIIITQESKIEGRELRRIQHCFSLQAKYKEEGVSIEFQNLFTL